MSAIPACTLVSELSCQRTINKQHQQHEKHPNQIQTSSNIQHRGAGISKVNPSQGKSLKLELPLDTGCGSPAPTSFRQESNESNQKSLLRKATIRESLFAFRIPVQFAESFWQKKKKLNSNLMRCGIITFESSRS